DGDGEDPGCRLSQAAAAITVGSRGHLGLLLARGVHPAGQPLGGKLALRGAEPPRARPDDDLGPEPAELVDGDSDGVRAEQVARPGLGLTLPSAPSRRNSATAPPTASGPSRWPEGVVRR